MKPEEHQAAVCIGTQKPGMPYLKHGILIF